MTLLRIGKSSNHYDDEMIIKINDGDFLLILFNYLNLTELMKFLVLYEN